MFYWIHVCVRHDFQAKSRLLSCCFLMNYCYGLQTAKKFESNFKWKQILCYCTYWHSFSVWNYRERFFLRYWYCLIRIRGFFFVRYGLYWSIKKMGSTVHSRTKPMNVFFFILLYNVYVLYEVRASLYQLNLQKQMHFGMWNVMVMLCLGWKFLKRFCSISSGFLQKITFQNFKCGLMIKANFNRM